MKLLANVLSLIIVMYGLMLGTTLQYMIRFNSLHQITYNYTKMFLHASRDLTVVCISWCSLTFIELLLQWTKKIILQFRNKNYLLYFLVYFRIYIDSQCHIIAHDMCNIN